MSEIQVNTINEYTGANGVTIDSVLIKDGLVDGVDVSSTGLILLSSNSVSASSGITVDSIFSSTYTNYKIVASITGSHTTTQFFRIVLRTSGVDNTSSTYTSGVRTFRISSDNEYEQRDDATTYFNLTGWDGSATNNRESIDITLYSPAETARTQYSGTYVTDEVAAQQMGYLGGTFENTTIFDGINIYPSAGTFTGQINIYGLVE